jgi:hypothetical protein
VQSNKKIISFSLYGNVPCYQVGAVINALEARRVYPEWTCRFYTTDDESVCRQLEYLGAEVVRMKDWAQGWRSPEIMKRGTFWRFLAADDSTCFISRDADSVVGKREAIAVKEWLDSSHQWHSIHGRGGRTKLMAGMWGYRSKEGKDSFGFDTNSMRDLIEDWLSLPQNQNWTPKKNKGRGCGEKVDQSDQNFLGQVIHPIAITDLLTHGDGNLKKSDPGYLPLSAVTNRYVKFIGEQYFRGRRWECHHTRSAQIYHSPI